MSDWQEKLEEAKDLFESGIISEHDFDELKAEVLRERDTLISYGIVEATPAIDEDANASSRIELVRISAGTFMMGALPNDDEASKTERPRTERPRHKVEISRDFYVGKYPVTQELWEAVMGNNPSHFKGEDCPVETVSWFDCVAFCNKLSRLENKELAYTINGENVSCNWSAKGYRLLTEGEWEYCARGGEYHLYAGSDNVDEVAWYRANSGSKTHPVGQKKPNGFGLYDMSGNVWEWCWDWFDSKVYQSRPVTGGELTSDPRGPTSGSVRVLRGGSWFDDARLTRVSNRDRYSPTITRSNIGFRLGRTP